MSDGQQYYEKRPNKDETNLSACLGVSMGYSSRRIGNPSFQMHASYYVPLLGA